jgi:hypothetical protein
MTRATGWLGLGALALAVASGGLLAWLLIGLDSPRPVTSSGAAYYEQSDVVRHYRRVAQLHALSVAVALAGVVAAVSVWKSRAGMVGLLAAIAALVAALFFLTALVGLCGPGVFGGHCTP